MCTLLITSLLTGLILFLQRATGFPIQKRSKSETQVQVTLIFNLLIVYHPCIAFQYYSSFQKTVFYDISDAPIYFGIFISLKLLSNYFLLCMCPPIFLSHFENRTKSYYGTTATSLEFVEIFTTQKKNFFTFSQRFLLA